MHPETYSITWRGIRIAVTYAPEKFGLVDHIELDSGDRTTLPVTETGYRSHHIPIGTVAGHGGPVAYVTAWLDHEAERTGWNGVQLSLF